MKKRIINRNQAEKDTTAKIDAIEMHRKIHLVPLDKVSGYDIRPGFYEINGATAIPGGVNFTVHSHNATSMELLLFKRTEDHPYAKAVTGQSKWGVPAPGAQHYKARVVKDDFDWGDMRQPLIPMEDLIIYELHVRGFTKHDSSGVKFPGTFSGLMEKLPYLLELGVNAVELMPIFEFDEMLDYRESDGKKLYNYWGYNTVSFFSPNTSYAASVEYNREGNELKQLISIFNKNGIEVYLDVVFNHTAEGNEDGPFFSFKGFDNNIYYLLTPYGQYYNFSGCGNTLNCNHPIVQQMIIDSLRYWVTTYRVDGFRFDLASIMGRNEDGSPMNKPPLLQSLAFDPILGGVKLIAEAWDAGGLYQVGNFPSWNRWAEWNGKYRDDIRRHLKGDSEMAKAAALRISGSQDIYKPDERKNASVNFITCHDGFTLYDLFSYNEKHNEKNGWDNTDGTNDNYSWNCGVEGETKDKEVLKLRYRMMKNACAILMCSRGIPMFLAGDEFGNTQFGNNNPYCQDNEISWLNWEYLKKNEEIFGFFKQMIQFRKEHPIIRKDLSNGIYEFPDVSFHGVKAWDDEYKDYDRYVGVMFAGKEESDRPDIIYVASNSYWEELEVELPQLPKNVKWVLKINTSENKKTYAKSHYKKFKINSRAVMVFIAQMN